MKKQGFVRRRWLNFRQGHGTYSSFVIGLLQFIVLMYEFLFNKWIPSLLLFGVIFIFTYIPATTAIGWYHNETQQETDMKMRMKYVVDEGRKSEKRLMKRLDKIEDKMGKRFVR